MDAIKQAHYNLAIAYLNDAQYSKAIPEFQTAIELDADFIDAHCGLARAYVEQDELDKAEMSATVALKLDANYPPALALLNSIKQAHYDKGITYLSDEHYSDAVETFQKAVTLDADFKYAHYYLGRTYIALQAYHKAVDSLQSAVALDANLEYAQYNLGYAYVEQGQYDKAIPHLEQAIALDANLKHAHYNLARAYQESGNLEAATHAVTETLRLDANYQPAHELVDTLKQAHYNRGITYISDERYSEAVAAFRSVIILDPDFTAAHYNLGVAYLKMETYRRAVDVLRKTIALDASYKAAHHALALAYFGQQEPGKARNAAKEALKVDANYQPARLLLEAIDPSFVPLEASSFTSPETQVVTPPRPEGASTPQPDAKPTKEVHHELGIAYLAAKKHTEAVAEFQKAIDLDPGFAAAHTSLGRVYLEIEQLDDAENAAQKALSVDANYHPACQLLEDISQARPTQPTQLARVPSKAPDREKHYEHGQAFLNNRQYNEAAAAFKKAVKADAGFAEAHYGLGLAYLEMGALDDAKTAAEEALRLKANRQLVHELLTAIKVVETNLRRRNRWKKGVFYAALLSIIAVGAFFTFRLGLINTNLPWISTVQPNLSIIGVALEEPSGNGFLDAGETARLKLIIRNSGGTARNVDIRLEPPVLAGLRFMKPALIPKLSANSIETLRISITADKNVQGREQSLEIQLFGKKEQLTTKDFSFTIIPETPGPEKPDLVPQRRQ